MERDKRRVLTAGDILAAEDMQREWSATAEGGDENTGVYVRVLTGKERDDFEDAVTIRKGRDTRVSYDNLRAQLVARACVDEGGQNIFTADQIEALGQKNARALDRIFMAAQRLSGLTTEDMAELAKNSSTARNDGSISG